MPELTGRDRLLFDQVTASLRETDQFEQIFEADDTTGIDKLRSIGRRVGRELGWKIRTFATTLDSGRVRVLIVVERSTPLREPADGHPASKVDQGRHSQDLASRRHQTCGLKVRSSARWRASAAANQPVSRAGQSRPITAAQGKSVPARKTAAVRDRALWLKRAAY